MQHTPRDYPAPDSPQDSPQARQEAFLAVSGALKTSFDVLPRAVEQWHEQEPQDDDALLQEAAEPGAMGIVPLLLAVHLANFKLWHMEDAARRDDLGAEHVARCKREIDAMNQRRNDRIEQLDARLESLIASVLPPATSHSYNTETMGGGLDRLSILHLKLYHMAQETEREDAGPGHVEGCTRKLALLQRQRDDLEQSLQELLAEYAKGRKRPMIYHQFKMYNDPATNPELYRQKRG